MKGKTFSLLLAALVFAFLLQTVADNGINQKNASEFEKLQQLASSKGEVKVIVKLNVPGIKELTDASNRFATVIPGKEAEWGGAQADMELKEAITRVTDSVLYNLGGTEYQVNHTYSSIPYLALGVSDEALAVLESLTEVLDIKEDKPIKLPLPVKEGQEQIAKDGTSPPVNTDTPRLDNTVSIIGADTAWGMGYTGAGWYVAVLDTGIRSSHEFFTGKTIVEACYALGENGAGDCPNGLTSMTGAGSAVHHPSTYRGWDHGTHVSGIAAGNYGNLFGVAKDANIIAVQVFSKFSASACGGSPCVMSWSSDSAAGLDYVYSIRGSCSIAAANMSLGGGANSSACDGEPQKAAIDNLRAAGIATAIATGNNGYCGYVSSPACISTSVAVGSSTDGDLESYFNNWHATMQQLFAPGSSVYSSTGTSDSSYASWSGTSMATPHVTGAWALLKQCSPAASVINLLNALRSTGVGITGIGDGYTTPIPRIHVASAVDRAGVITVTSPNGGEDWVLGTVHNITWTSSGLTNNIHIGLRKNDTNVALIAKNINPAPGSYSWTVGDCLKGAVTAGTNYKVLILEKGSSVRDTSDASFEISTVVPTLTVTSPNGGEDWQYGTTQDITWTATALSNNIHIGLRKNDTNVALIAKNVDPALGSYSWRVGDCMKGSANPGSNYKILLLEKGSTVRDTSDASFDISPGTASWTFMVYLDADNNLESYGIDDFLEMSSVGSSGEVSIVVQFDRINGYASSYDDWETTKRFYVTSGMTPTAANAVMDIGEANMGDPATLINFVNWAKTNYPATNYALIMWDHGGGWRDSKKAMWQERKKDKKNDLVFKAVCWDDTNGGDCLYMSEVKDALSSCGGTQLIGFDACLMSMVEAAYEVRAHGQVMVGSEETEPGDGWPYDTIMSDLTANPSWTPSQLGSAIADRYYASYGNDETQAAVDLTNLDTLAGTISTFAQSMIDNWNSDEAAVKSAAQDVITQIDNTVINEKHGNSWPGANGLAIYFPETVGEFDADYNGTIIEFANDTQWEEFLEEFHTSMSGSWLSTRRDSSQEFYYNEHVDLYHFCELLQLEQLDYYTESQIIHTFVGGGTAQGLQDDDWYITYSLPFDLRYFGQTFPAGSDIYISTNGYVDFDSGSDHSDYSNSTSALAANKRIAPCWEDLTTDGSAQTGEDIYITENTDNLVIRWVAETLFGANPVNVELILYDDGRIQLDYGSGNTGLDPTIGISKGDSINYYLSIYDSQDTLTNVASDMFTPIDGTIRVLAPNGGETWNIGNPENITWDSTGVVGNVRIELYKDASLVGLIADDVDSTSGSYSWTVGSYDGGTAAAAAGYTIKISEIGSTVTDTSDSSFTISDE